MHKYNHSDPCCDQGTEKTHFNLVGEFHFTFDHPLRTTPYYECFDNDKKLLYFRLSLIKEEMKEFTVALEKNDMIEMADALCDLSYVTYGAGHCLGIDIDRLLVDMKINLTTPENILSVNKLSSKTKNKIKKYLNLIDKCINSFSNSIDTHDMGEIAEYLAYILKHAYALGHMLNFNMDKMFREVHRSNMTKVCSSIDDANTSIDLYRNDPEKRYQTPLIKLKGSYYVIYDEISTKILKNYKWEKPNIKQFFT